MNPRVRGYLDLLRIPNVFTALADTLAGFLYAGGSLDQWSAVAWLCLSSACLYCGGIVLNDVGDAALDAQLRPARPIPSGRVSRRSALTLAIVLLASGSAAAWAVSPRSCALAGTLTIGIVLYDVLLKPTPIAPACMGLCRALNLALGMSIAPVALIEPPYLLPIGLMWLYVTSVTFFARREETGDTRARLTAASVGIVAAIFGQAAVIRILPAANASALFSILSLGILTAFAAFRAVRYPAPDVIQSAVKTFILYIILFDASLAWIAAGPLAALAVSALLVPAVILALLFRMT